MKTKNIAPGAALILALAAAGCANHQAAQVGVAVGQTIGRPLGAAVVAIDEAFSTAGDVVAANPRYAEPRERESAQRDARCGGCCPTPPCGATEYEESIRLETRTTRTTSFDRRSYRSQEEEARAAGFWQ
ncbi:MAG: hypothetical protein JXR37_31685 [Kiritimatiellae bacterium]|nr:hypothetical protein [Kiritimatiellia bacterium]